MTPWFPAIRGDALTGIVSFRTPVAGNYTARTAGRLKLLNLGQRGEVARTLFDIQQPASQHRPSGCGPPINRAKRCPVEGAIRNRRAGNRSFRGPRPPRQHLRNGMAHAGRRAGVEWTDPCAFARDTDQIVVRSDRPDLKQPLTRRSHRRGHRSFFSTARYQRPLSGRIVLPAGPVAALGSGDCGPAIILDTWRYRTYSVPMRNAIWNNGYENGERPSAHSTAATRRQHGVVLFVALIAMVVVSLAGVALIRSVDTTGSVAGNRVSRRRSPRSTAVEEAVQALYSQRSIVNTEVDDKHTVITKLQPGDLATGVPAVLSGTYATSKGISVCRTTYPTTRPGGDRGVSARGKPPATHGLASSSGATLATKGVVPNVDEKSRRDPASDFTLPRAIAWISPAPTLPPTHRSCCIERQKLRSSGKPT